MKVLILGAGVVGVSSAWYLSKAGHEVTVVDRQPDAGLETSFANGGQIAVSHAEPWSTPHAPLRALSWVGREGTGIRYDHLTRGFQHRPDVLGWTMACGSGKALADIVSSRTPDIGPRTF